MTGRDAVLPALFGAAFVLLGLELAVRLGGPAATAVAFYAVLPRFAAALLAGAALGLSGSLMQAALRNPLASPGTLGISAGAQLALAAATLFAPGLLAAPGREVVAFTGAAGAAGLVLLLAAPSRLAPLTVLLCGLLVALGAGSLGGVLVLLHGRQLSELFLWAGGSLVQDGWNGAGVLGSRLLLGIAATVLLARPMRLLDLPDATARGLGVAVPAVRGAGLAVAVGLAATTVALVGVIGFVGLAAPALVRLLRPGRFAPVRCLLAGAALLAVTDGLVARAAGLTAELLPTGAATALLGAPLLLLLLRTLRPVGGDRPLTLPAGPLRRVGPLLLLLAGALLVLAILALLAGRSASGWAVGTEFILLRIPRVAGAGTAGAMLGLSGFLLQRVLRNPVASPDVIGTGTGTVLGLIGAVGLGFTGTGPRLLAGGLGGAAAALVLLLFSRGGAAPARMLLAGLALGSAFEGVLALLLATGDPRAELILLFLSGTTYFLDGATVLGALAVLLLLGTAVLLLRRPLDALLLDDAMQESIGLQPGRARVALLLLAAGLAGVATLLAGPLSFVGLVAPHGARLLGTRRTVPALAAAALLGAGAMVGADWLGRTLLFPAEVPAGAVAAVLGGPLLILLLLRRA